MRKKITGELYDLIPSQQSMYLMVKYSIHKQVIQIPTSFALDKEIDFDLLGQALNIEIAHNDCLRLRFTKAGGDIKQYFLPEYRIDDMPVHTFATKEEQEAFFKADAEKPVRFFNDETFRIHFFKSFDGQCGIYLNASHLIMDAMGVMIFYLDLLKIYMALSKNEEMPEPLDKYEDYIKKDLAYLKNEKRMERDREFFKKFYTDGGEPFYASVHGPEILEEARRKENNPNLRVPEDWDALKDKADVIVRSIKSEDAKLIFDYCMDKKIAPECLLEFGIRTHASMMNYRTPDVFLMPLCSRRATKSEKHMGGCITQPYHLRTIIPETSTFTEATNQILKLRTQFFMHINFPFTGAREIMKTTYNYSVARVPVSLMFSWIPIPYIPDSDINIDFKGYCPGRYVMPLYIIAYPNPKTMTIDINYMRRIKSITPEDIDRLHDSIVKVLTEGIKNPDITVGGLLDSITPENK